MLEAEPGRHLLGVAVLALRPVVEADREARPVGAEAVAIEGERRGVVAAGEERADGDVALQMLADRCGEPVVDAAAAASAASTRRSPGGSVQYSLDARLAARPSRSQQAGGSFARPFQMHFGLGT